MKIISTYPAQPDLIAEATSDDGRVSYAPIGNGRLMVDGRHVYHGRYTDSRGRMTDERPAGPLWETALRLMADVDRHNEAARARLDQEEADRLERSVSEASVRVAADMWRPDSDL